MKKRLIPFYSLMIISIIAGYITGNSIYYIFFWTFIFVFFLSLISLAISYFQFNYTQIIEPKENIKQKIAKLEMRVYNEFIFPMPTVELIYDLPDENLSIYETHAAFSVPSRDYVLIAQDVFCKYIGEWSVGIRKAILHDVFGLLKLTLDFYKRPNYRTLSLKIKPRVINIETLPLPERESISAQTPNQKLTPDIAEDSDIRKFIQGDILKKVHWKLSASKRELMVKQFSNSLSPDMLVYIDLTRHGKVGFDAIILEDMIVECCVAVANYMLKKNHKADFIFSNDEKMVLSGQQIDDFDLIYEAMSNITFESNFEFFDFFSDDLSENSYSTSVFIVSHSINSKGFDSLVYLNQAAVSITFLLISFFDDITDEIYKILTELKTLGVKAVHISPGDDINLCIKEQVNEKMVY